MKRLALAVALLAATTSAQTKSSAKPDWRAVHKSAIVADTHADTPMRFYYEGYDIAGPRGDGYIDLKAIKDGNLGAEIFSIFLIPSETPPNQYFAVANGIIDSVEKQVKAHPDQLEFARTAADIRRIRGQKNPKMAVLMGVEGGHMIEDSLDNLRHFYDRGVRYMTLTWANTNNWADSSGDLKNEQVKHHNGLTDFGKQVVREMNRLGMMVDISHVSDKTFWDTIEVTQAPVIASHSSARALTNHARNMTDEMLKAVAKNGGVVQVNFASFFVDENYRQAYAAQKKEADAATAAHDAKFKNADTATRFREHWKVEREWSNKIPRPPLKSLIDHIDHIAKVAGVDHVGLGSDFDGIDSSPAGMDSAADLPKITQALMERGYSPEDLKKILGENLLRVMEQVESIARKQATQTATARATGSGR